MVCWLIWADRNVVVHRGAAALDVCKRDLAVLFLVYLTCSKSSKTGKSLARTRTAVAGWLAPMAGGLKLNTDGSCGIGKVTGLGIVFRDENREIVLAQAEKFEGALEVLSAEATALLNGSANC